MPCRPSETDTYPDQVQFTELGASSINKGVLLREFGVAERESLQLLDDLGRMCTNHVSLFEDVISTPAGILPYPSDVSVLLSELNKLEDALTGLTGRMTVQAAQLQGKRDDLGYDEGEADDDDRATLESMAQLRDRVSAIQGVVLARNFLTCHCSLMQGWFLHIIRLAALTLLYG